MIHDPTSIGLALEGADRKVLDKPVALKQSPLLVITDFRTYGALYRPCSGHGMEVASFLPVIWA